MELFYIERELRKERKPGSQSFGPGAEWHRKGWHDMCSPERGGFFRQRFRNEPSRILDAHKKLRKAHIATQFYALRSNASHFVGEKYRINTEALKTTELINILFNNTAL